MGFVAGYRDSDKVIVAANQNDHRGPYFVARSLMKGDSNENQVTWLEIHR